jgi:hypothetical protein
LTVISLSNKIGIDNKELLNLSQEDAVMGISQVGNFISNKVGKLGNEIKSVICGSDHNEIKDKVTISCDGGKPCDSCNEVKPKPEGSIKAGLLAAALGGALIAAASVGIPALGAVGPGLLNAAMRLVGVISIHRGAKQVMHEGEDTKSNFLRGTILTAMGAASMAACLGVFGPIGGLTELALGVGGFVGACKGLGKMKS